MRVPGPLRFGRGAAAPGPLPSRSARAGGDGGPGAGRPRPALRPLPPAASSGRPGERRPTRPRPVPPHLARHAAVVGAALPEAAAVTLDAPHHLLLVGEIHLPDEGAVAEHPHGRPVAGLRSAGSPGEPPVLRGPPAPGSLQGGPRCSHQGLCASPACALRLGFTVVSVGPRQ